MKERIRQAAAALFYKYGIRTVTMDDIAKELGISKKTIYLHFQDKNEIVNAIIEEIINDSCEDVRCLQEVSRDPIEELVNSIHLIKEKLTRLDHKLLSDLKKYYPETWRKLMKYEYDYRLNLIRSNLQEGVNSGLYRAEIDIEILALLRVKHFEQGLDPETFPPDQFSYLTVQEELVTHFIHGLLSEKGKKRYYEYIQKSKSENKNL